MVVLDVGKEVSTSPKLACMFRSRERELMVATSVVRGKTGPRFSLLRNGHGIIRETGE